jgi:hypothetical protein
METEMLAGAEKLLFEKASQLRGQQTHAEVFPRNYSKAKPGSLNSEGSIPSQIISWIFTGMLP